jgi:hypothetical protein
MEERPRRYRGIGFGCCINPVTVWKNWRLSRRTSSAIISMDIICGIGAHLTNEEKRAHLTDLRREHLIDQVCVEEILPPES